MRCGKTARPPSRHAPRAVAFSPYHRPRHSRATDAASGTPSFSQSSRATNWRARSEPGSRAAKARNLRSARLGSRAGEEGLEQIHRQLAQGIEQRLEGRQKGGQHRGLLGPLGMEIPGGRQQRQAGEIAGAAMGKAEGQIAAHAIADQHGPLAAGPDHRIERPGQPAQDVIGEIEAPLGLARAPANRRETAGSPRAARKRMKLRSGSRSRI